MQPRPISETRGPVEPSERVCMCFLLFSMYDWFVELEQKVEACGFAQRYFFHPKGFAIWTCLCNDRYQYLSLHRQAVQSIAQKMTNINTCQCNFVNLATGYCSMRRTVGGCGAGSPQMLQKR